MRNLTNQVEKFTVEEGKTLDTGMNGIVLYDENGEPYRIHFSAGFLYINKNPWGVEGMPPANHALTHGKNGQDAITPESINAVDVDDVSVTSQPNKIPKLNVQGKLDSNMLPLASKTNNGTAKIWYENGNLNIETR